jgi:hypothetical protein
MDEQRERREPVPEPAREVADMHSMPLDRDDDAQWLREDDPRRIEIERRRGRPFARIKEWVHDLRDDN